MPWMDQPFSEPCSLPLVFKTPLSEHLPIGTLNRGMSGFASSSRVTPGKSLKFTMFPHPESGAQKIPVL